MGRLSLLNNRCQTPQLLLESFNVGWDPYALAAGDYVEVQVFQNSSNPLLIRSIPAT